MNGSNIIRFCIKLGRVSCGSPQRLISSTSSAMAAADDRSRFFPDKKDTMLPKDTFKGKIVFITGGASGLGKGMATILSSLGGKVAITGRGRSGNLVETAKEISQQTGNEVIGITLNVRSADSVKEAVDECVNKLGLPDIVINNAAGNFISPTEKLSPNAWNTIIETVLNGTAYVTLDIGKRLIKAKKGASFLAITTPYAETGSGYVVPSAAAKAGVENLTKSLTAEWGKYGMRFNCIAPGPIHTPGAMERLDPSSQFRDLAIDTLPIGRFGEIKEIANLASYIVSDYANWMTGAIIFFDGGQVRELSGSMNKFKHISAEQWDLLESMIRKTTEKSKSNL